MPSTTDAPTPAFTIRGARTALEERAVAAAVALPAVVVQAKGHGHAGTAMALAPTAHVLYQRVLRHDPADPAWPGRDRFILSAGHASLLLYAQLYLTGYGLTLDDLAASRTLDARTPGHPELGHTPGVEMSTGPLGQGVASAVGLALAARRDAALHDRGADLWDPTVFVLAGDGCLQEGVASEASSLAGTLGVDNLVLIWDDNGITIDGPTDIAFSEDVRARYKAYGWRVIDVDDHRDLDAIESALLQARARDGRPTLVAVRTVIGAPAPAKAGTPAAHAGALGAADVAAALTALGFAPDATLADLVPPEVLAWARLAQDRGAALRLEWQARLAGWETAAPDAARARRSVRDVDTALGAVETTSGAATRVTNGAVIRALHASGHLWGGSADLAGSTSVAVPGEPAGRARPDGDFIPFGIREHAMAAILAGIALHGLWRPYGSTYLAFSDYQRPSLRLAALMGLPVINVYTHDSVAVGEDGPTHQPVEQIASLRTVPGLDVVRPADGAEVVAAWRRILATPDAPTALVLSRQPVAVLPERTGLDREVAHGGYVVWQHGAGDELAILATGSEVGIALEAGQALAADGVAVRVVSMPCVEWFLAAPADWRESVLPTALRARVTVEAGRGDGWYRWAGLDGEVVSIEEFGESGSGAQVLARRGITADHVLVAARATMERTRPGR